MKKLERKKNSCINRHFVFFARSSLHFLNDWKKKKKKKKTVNMFYLKCYVVVVALLQHAHTGGRAGVGEEAIMNFSLQAVAAILTS